MPDSLRIFITCAILSPLVFLAVALGLNIWRKRSDFLGKYLSGFYCFAAGVFLALTIILFPVSAQSYAEDFNFWGIRALFLSIHTAMRCFILDGELDMMNAATVHLPQAFRLWYTFYGAVLYVLAPVMTVGFILSFFRNFTTKMRIAWQSRKPVFYFSELNHTALTLAADVREKNPDALIVFADVYPEDGEDSYEMRKEAERIRAFCVRDDVEDLISRKNDRQVEYFLIGEEQGENMSQAVTIAEASMGLFNKKIFVFSDSEEDEGIIESVDWTPQISLARKEAERTKLSEVEFNKQIMKLRLVNVQKQLAWSIVAQKELFECIRKDENGENVLSALIIGFGRYGTEFFKTLLWFGQMAGCRLEINIVDIADGSDPEKPDAESLISWKMPGVLLHNDERVPGEDFYSVRTFSGINAGSGAFRDMFLNADGTPKDDETGRRLRRTTWILTSMGDDNANIGQALAMRRIFDQLNDVNTASGKPEGTELPRIFAIVLDNEKAEKLNSGKGLINYKEIPYHVRAIGKLSERYGYDAVYPKQTEDDAFRYHVEWDEAEREKQLRSAGNDAAKRAAIEEQFDRQRRENYIKYERFSYFRDSSIAKSLHKIAVHANPAISTEQELELEQMRWNAYMRTNGYLHGDRSDSRAKLHKELRRFEAKDEEQMKKNAGH